jgi:nicotinamide phosphoribosyltransferase
MYYYNMNKMTAFSVPASEHSTITSWMRKGEKAAYRNILKKFGGKYPIFACVSDSYNVFEATDMWAEMKDDIIKCGSMLVIRPDSGNPVEVVMRLILMLDSKFGHTMNKKGYRVLNHVRILWGDGIEEGVISEILYTLMGYGFSAENLTYGMGGALLQKIDRDTQKFAMKCSFGIIDDEEVEIYKDPITDAGKASKRGQQMLYKAANDGSFITRKENEYINGKIDGVEYTEALETIWDTGVLFVDDNFDQVRARAA